MGINKAHLSRGAHNFDRQFSEEQDRTATIIRYIMEVPQFSACFVNKNYETQKSGVDFYAFCPKINKWLSIEIKTHTTDYHFMHEMLIETEHYGYDGEFRDYGWGLKNLYTDMFMDINLQSQQSFLYKATFLTKFSEAYNQGAIPKATHSGYSEVTAKNNGQTKVRQYITKNRLVPRNYFQKYLKWSNT